MHNVVASFGERVKSDKESIGCDFPCVICLCFVFEVSFLELGANVNGTHEFFMGFLGLFVLDESEDHFSIDEFAGLGDNSIANFSDENNKSAGSVVVLRVVPDEENDMHYGYEEVWELIEFL